MFERILYIISEKQEEKHQVLTLVQKQQSTVLITAINPVANCPPSRTEGTTRQVVRIENYERRCWQNIYRLEEEFKQAGVKASVVAQLSTIDNIQFLASTTHCDLVILPISILADHDYQLPEELLPNLPCPLLLMPNG